MLRRLHLMRDDNNRSHHLSQTDLWQNSTALAVQGAHRLTVAGAAMGACWLRLQSPTFLRAISSRRSSSMRFHSLCSSKDCCRNRASVGMRLRAIRRAARGEGGHNSLSF